MQKPTFVTFPKIISSFNQSRKAKVCSNSFFLASGRISTV